MKCWHLNGPPPPHRCSAKTDMNVFMPFKFSVMDERQEQFIVFCPFFCKNYDNSFRRLFRQADGLFAHGHDFQQLSDPEVLFEQMC